MNKMNIRVHLTVSGRVQGVCYRVNAQDEANRLGLVGWIRNEENGCVEAEAEGPESAVHDFIEWCRRGPRYAQVSNLETWNLVATGGEDRFDIVG